MTKFRDFELDSSKYQIREGTKVRRYTRTYATGGFASREIASDLQQTTRNANCIAGSGCSAAALCSSRSNVGSIRPVIGWHT